MKKKLTLAIIRRDSEVLLGMKKRGFGAGKWNGFGGKVEPDKTIEAAARRELREEAGIEAAELERIGILDFEFQGNPEILEVHVFRGERFSGEPREGEEMRPQWFDVGAIPYGEMWPDDMLWLPLLLEGRKFKGRFLFGPSNEIIEQELMEIDEVP